MVALTGRTPQVSYGDLVQVSNANAGIDGTLRQLEAGVGGVKSAVYVSTAGMTVNGKIGAGMAGTAASKELHASGLRSMGLRLDNTQDAVTATITLENGGSNEMRLNSPGFMSFYANATAQGRIDTTGFGIGNVTPTQLIHALKAANAVGAILIQNTTAGTLATAEHQANADTASTQLGVTSSAFTTAGGVALNQGYWKCGGAGGMVVQANNAAGFVAFQTGGTTERARIDNSGNVLVGVASGSNHILKRTAAEAAIVIQFQDTVGTFATLFGADGTAGNAAACALSINKNSSTSRAINAGGTVNASGTDYAEYETKADDCGVVAKGQIVGFDGDGLIVDKFSRAVTFGVKSTNPSYVGGDTWGHTSIVGARPVAPLYQPPAYVGRPRPQTPPAPSTASLPAAPPEVALAPGPDDEDDVARITRIVEFSTRVQQRADLLRARESQVAQFNADQKNYGALLEAYRSALDGWRMDQTDYAVQTKHYQDAYDLLNGKHLAELADWEAQLEAERQKVDRIAYSGKVPLIAKGGQPGDFVVPVAGLDDSIDCVFSKPSSIGIMQYMMAIGQVRRILPDGRPEIAVKVS